MAQVYDHSASTPATQLRFRVRTPDRWISCAVTTRHRRLNGVLNREGPTAMLIVDAQVGDDGVRTEGVALNLATILFAVEDQSLPRRLGGSRVKKHPERVRLGIGPFEIEGELHIAEGSTRPGVLMATHPPFLVLASAAVSHRDQPWPAEVYPVVFVNRRLLEYARPVSIAETATLARSDAVIRVPVPAPSLSVDVPLGVGDGAGERKMPTERWIKRPVGGTGR